MTRKFAIFLGLLFALAANAVHAQEGEKVGETVTAKPTKVDTACGDRTVEQEVKDLCADYERGNNFLKDPTIKAAFEECKVFYSLAVRLQNSFCSYSREAEAFRVEAIADVKAEGAGNSNQAQVVVAEKNAQIVDINQRYLTYIKDLAPKFIESNKRYIARVGRLNGQAGNDEPQEARCYATGVQSQTPAYVRKLLALAGHGTAHLTYNSIIRAVRENVRRLQEVKDKAERNAGIASMRGIQAGAIFSDAVAEVRPEIDSRQDMTAKEAAVTGLIQHYGKKVIGRVPMMAGKANIIGSAAAIGYQLYTNKRVLYPETGALFVGMIAGAPAGFAAQLLVIEYRENMEHQRQYREFAHKEVAKNINISAMELITLWGQKSKNPECAKAAAVEQACIEKRARGEVSPYDAGGGSCYKPPVR